MPVSDAAIHPSEIVASTASLADVFESSSAVRVAMAPALDSLPPEVKEAFESLKENLTEDEQALVYHLVTSEAFGNLGHPRAENDLTIIEQQLQILYLAGGQNPLSQGVRSAIASQRNINPNRIVSRLTGQAYLGQPDFVRDLVDGTFSNSPPAPYSLSEADNDQTLDGLSAKVQKLLIMEKTILLKSVEGATLTPESVSEAIARLPASSVGLLDEVEIHPEKAGTLAEASNRKEGVGLIRLYDSPHHHSQDNLAETIVHETGHTLNFGNNGFEALAIMLEADSAKKRDRLAPSNYAQASGLELFAEYYLLYVVFKEMGFLEELKYIFPNTNRLMRALVEQHGPFPEGR